MGKPVVAVLHTTPVTVSIVKELMGKEWPEADILNFVDDSILPMLRKEAGMMPYVYEKLLAYSQFAKRQEALGVLSACSSIGEFAEFAKGKLSIPVARIDAPMMEKAAQAEGNIVLAATLPTTLGPSERLLRRVCGEERTVTACLLDDAYALLSSQGKEAHDRRIAQRLLPFLEHGDTVVLAQASMAAAQAYLPPAFAPRMLTSPESGVRAFAAQMRAAQ